MSKFLTELEVCLVDDDDTWILRSPLVYESNIVGTVTVPAGFLTDFASVPRVPVVYRLYGDRAHRESVLHDYLYCLDSVPLVSFSDANKVFFEAMECRGKPFYIRHPMYWGVCLGGLPYYHRRKVGEK